MKHEFPPALATLNIASPSGPATLPSAPAVWTQAPGYYRLRLGDFEITALNDGVHEMTFSNLLRGASPEEIQRRFEHAYLADPVAMSINGYLINTGTRLILIDTGCGTLMGPTTGHLLANMRTAGYGPDQIDEVCLTHLHRDHVGGLTTNGQVTFPNAIVRVPRRETEYWFDATNRSRASSDDQLRFEAAVRALEPYKLSGRFAAFDGDIELVPGIYALATQGHTAGHSCYVIEGGAERMIVLGDLIHAGAVQLARPHVSMTFDYNPEAAATERSRILRLAAQEGACLAGAHLSFPGIGHVRARDQGYEWIPVNYASTLRREPRAPLP